MLPTLLELEKYGNLERGYGPDFINVASRVKFVLDALDNPNMGNPEQRLAALQKLPLYRDHFSGQPEILKASDEGIVAQLDTLVNEFNRDLERIKKDKDYNALRQFWRNAQEIFGL